MHRSFVVMVRLSEIIFIFKISWYAYIILANASHQSPEITCGKAFNFSLDSKVSVLDIVSQITTLMGKESLRPVILNEAKGEILHQYLSSEKANNILGWSPAYNLEQGLDETIAWYVDFLDQQSH